MLSIIFAIIISSPSHVGSLCLFPFPVLAADTKHVRPLCGYRKRDESYIIDLVKIDARAHTIRRSLGHDYDYFICVLAAPLTAIRHPDGRHTTLYTALGPKLMPPILGEGMSTDHLFAREARGRPPRGHQRVEAEETQKQRRATLLMKRVYYVYP